MTKYRVIKTGVSLALAGIILFQGLPVSAARSVKEIETDKSNLQKEINGLDEKLVNLLTDIDVLKKEKKQKEAEIKDAEEELKAAEAAKEEQHTDMKSRMRYSYENREKSVLTILVESGNVADFLNQVDYAKSVNDYDRKLLNSYEATCQGVEDLKDTLEEENAALAEKQDQLSAKKKSLSSMISSKRSQMKNFDKELAKAKEEARRRAEAEAARRAAAEAEANAAAAAAAAQREAAAAEAASQQSSASNQSSQTTPAPTPTPETVPATDPQDHQADATGGNGAAVVTYACQFVGNPYKWGGNSLTQGCDCSGFVVLVYQNFGVNLWGTRNSAALRGVGRAVTLDKIMPGDIVCYNGHVAIYAGGGKIVEAQSSRAGITCSRTVTHAPIVAIRRVL